jgi:hypothetical protein
VIPRCVVSRPDESRALCRPFPIGLRLMRRPKARMSATAMAAAKAACVSVPISPPTAPVWRPNPSGAGRPALWPVIGFRRFRKFAKKDGLIRNSWEEAWPVWIGRSRCPIHRRPCPRRIWWATAFG